MADEKKPNETVGLDIENSSNDPKSVGVQVTNSGGGIGASVEVVADGTLPVTGVRVVQIGLGTGMRVVQSGPGIGMKVTVVGSDGKKT